MWFSPRGVGADKNVKYEFGKAWAWFSGTKAWGKPLRDCRSSVGLLRWVPTFIGNVSLLMSGII